jgi:hypothetical protein
LVKERAGVRESPLLYPLEPFQHFWPLGENHRLSLLFRQLLIHLVLFYSFSYSNEILFYFLRDLEAASIAPGLLFLVI